MNDQNQTTTINDASSVFARRAMLATLSCSAWHARKYDKQLSEDAARQHGAPSESVRATKRLFVNEPAGYKRILAALTQASVIFKKLTMPWNQDGQRILPAQLHGKLVAEIRKCEIELESAIAAFLPVEYPAAIAEAQANFNGLFDINLYPAAVQFPELFAIRLRIDPIPDADDWRINLAQEDREVIIREVKKNQAEDMKAAVRSLYERLGDTIADLRDRLNAKDKKDPNKPGIFRDTAITNLTGLLDLLPALNIANDAGLELLADRIRTDLIVKPDDLRQSPEMRADVAKKADDLIADLRDMF